MTDTPYFEQKTVLKSCHVGPDRVLRTAELFRMFQELTIACTEAAGVTRARTLDRGLLWIIPRQAAAIARMPVYGEALTLRCTALPTMHLFFPRWCEVFAGGERVVSCRTLWLLIDETTRMPVFPEEHGIFIEGAAPPDGWELPGAVEIPDDLAPAFEQDVPAPYFMADLNGHLSNTGYFSLAEELYRRKKGSYGALPAPAALACDYVSEIRPGGTIRLQCYERGSDVFFRGSAGGREAFRIQYTLQTAPEPRRQRPIS